MSLKFQNYNLRGKKVKGNVKVFLASAYFPSSDDIEEYEDFLTVTQTAYLTRHHQTPSKSLEQTSTQTLELEKEKMTEEHSVHLALTE